jgi:CRISPR/Cas system-associated exonuclease Cas4 (RecB family)
MSAPPFSYSSLSTFITCPKQYEADKVLKYIPHEDTQATLYGKGIHKAAELYIRDSTPLPAKYTYIKNYLDTLNAIEGDKFCELEMGIKRIVDEYGELDYTYCEFEDPTRYWRGIADLVIVNLATGTAYLVDYKSGKSSKYADTKQLGLLAAALFLKYPTLKRIKAMLLFVVAGELIKAEYSYETRFDIFDTLREALMQREAAYRSGVFNPKPNGLCRQWCKANRCVYNGSYVGDNHGICK